jgi:hypothetical protein
MSTGGCYVAQMTAVSVSTAITLVQVKAGAAPLQLVRCWVSQSSSVTNAMQRIGIVRKSVAATVTSFTPLETNDSSLNSLAVGGTAATGITATAEGTDSVTLFPDAFSILNGWLWFPTSERERVSVPPSGIIGIKFLAAPSAAITVTAGICWEEWN